MRPQEQKIWNNTRNWLNSSADNKLLFIIDEAHMYRGSSGGEVALLIRRLMNKLQIDCSKMQFILTTASMPNKTQEDKDSVHLFARELTASEDDNFAYLFGDRISISNKEEYTIPFENFNKALLPLLDENEGKRLEAINQFWRNVKGYPYGFNNLIDAEEWMYFNLNKYAPFKKLMNDCRGNAVSLRELSRNIFPGKKEEDALSAVSVMLAIAPIAKYKNNVLFPARMHMLFRAIKAVYACTNENCTHSTSDGKMTLGDVFLSNAGLQCPVCGSSVYELINDRRCGALFYKGYIHSKDITSTKQSYLWRYPGIYHDETMKEIHLYIPEKDYSAPTKKSKNPIKPCYLEKESGFISFNDDTHHEDPRYRKLYYCEFESPDHPNVLTFSVCPHCEKMLSRGILTPFQMRGNEAFYNLIRSQFNLEPPVPGKDQDLVHLPNQGRKVLLFSDSRQRAARLARDMSFASDTMATRALFTLAVKRMNDTDPEHSNLDNMYGYFVYESALHHIQLFNDSDRLQFLDEQRKTLSFSERASRRGRKFTPDMTFSQNATNGACEQLISLFCGPYNTMNDAALIWFEPADDELFEIADQTEMDDNLVIELFSAWLNDICENNAAIGQNIDDVLRANVISHQTSFGLNNDWKFRGSIRSIMGWKKNSEMELTLHQLFTDLFLVKSRNGEKYYVNLNKIVPHFNTDHKWIKCEKCANISPYPLKGKCPVCESSSIHEFTEKDYQALSFWRKPIFDAIEGDPIRVIDTEEHTAQLSYKDERDDTWSRTERYEMRFQDLIQDNESPVDILSSTTTMEVGIDIGSLVAIGLRNIPPMRENYQQRAGRAGRRGSSLSTILTFCEDGPHDAMYFQSPEPMFRGDPRKPWIDISSTKLILRHLTIVAIESFFDEYIEDSSIDSFSAGQFLDQFYESFINYVIRRDFNINKVLLPSQGVSYRDFISFVSEQFAFLLQKYDNHPELFISDSPNGDDKYKNSKSLLDALYEEGIIPTFSFPKNVVSATVMDGQTDRIKYQVQRGLDIAISEYAPGKSIVIDKQTFQIGGLFDPNVMKYYKKALNPASSFVNDDNYLKQIIRCPNCGWFGLESDHNKECPFCGNKDLLNGMPMLKPWGFGPVNGRSISVAQLDEAYTMPQQPLYSTVPDKDTMSEVDGFKKLRIASRNNQRIIMVNSGNNDHGFQICEDCGAAMPVLGVNTDPVKKIGRPYLRKYPSKPCRHNATQIVSLGYDFITDMLVLEFNMDSEIINTDRKNPWIERAATSLAEALRLSASRLLDIEFAELNTGYRIRNNQNGTFIDIYLYDSLSSGAGYSVSIAYQICDLLKDVRDLLSSCDCDSACTKCLKHFGNQFIQGKLDRFAALELLNYAETGELTDSLSVDDQYQLVKPIIGLLNQNGIKIGTHNDSLILNDSIYLTICPAMWKTRNDTSNLYISDVLVKYAKPYAYTMILNACGLTNF